MKRTIFFGPYTYEHFKKQFVSYVNEGDWVLDIGSNIGCATAPLSDMVGPNGRVICFEANPHFVEEAKENLKDRRNIDLYDYACGYEYGSMDYYYFLDNGQVVDYTRNVHVSAVPYFINDKKTKLSVKTVDTNDFIFKNYNNDLHKIKFIKVDAEGYDTHIVNNLKPLIDSIKPIIQMEWLVNPDWVVHNTIESTQFMIDTIESLNYDIYYVHKDLSISSVDLMEHLMSLKNCQEITACDLILKPRQS